MYFEYNKMKTEQIHRKENTKFDINGFFKTGSP